VKSVLLICAALLPLSAFAADNAGKAGKSKDDYPYLNYGIEAWKTVTPKKKGDATTSGGKSARQKNRRPQPKVDHNAPIATQADDELEISKDEQSTQILPSPATVQIHVEPVPNPIQRPKFRVGLFVQPYRPQGTMQVSTLQPYDLGTLSTQPMVILETRWLPVRPEAWHGVSFGLYGSAGYAQNSVDLKSPIGFAIEKTHLASIKAQVGLTSSWRPFGDSGWSFDLNAGAGSLQSAQSSSSSYADHTTSLLFASLGLGIERNITERWSIAAGYDNRSPIRGADEGAAIPRDNFLLGLMGNFQ
jgi:hypothetical protein